MARSIAKQRRKSKKTKFFDRRMISPFYEPEFCQFDPEPEPEPEYMAEPEPEPDEDVYYDDDETASYASVFNQEEEDKWYEYMTEKYRIRDLLLYYKSTIFGPGAAVPEKKIPIDLLVMIVKMIW